MATKRPGRASEPGALSLREYWEQLRSGRTDGAAASASPASPASPAPASPAPTASAPPPPPPAAPFFGSGGSSGAGSGGGGYGLGLIVPDRFSRERILGIMKTLCEKDAEKRKP